MRARFVLGYYSAHLPDRRADLLPSPLRLHAALVAAAGNGVTAVPGPAGLRRTESAARALEWFEENPPEYIELPDWSLNRREGGPAFAYRDEGVVELASKSSSRRKSRRDVAESTAIGGAIGWGWERMPDDVREELSLLCDDVPCLGEADSPVVLEMGEIVPTHRRALNQSPFASAAIRLAVPRSGRLDELDALYESANPMKSPSFAADKWKVTEQPAPSAITHAKAVDVGYDQIGHEAPASPAAPWETVVHLPIDRDISAVDRVAWSVTLHRALVSALGDEATSLVTGRYSGGATTPANRIAIQPMTETLMELSRNSALGSGIAILLPAGAIDAVAPALRRLKRLYRGASGSMELGMPSVLSAAEFWRPAASGTRRLWTTFPAMIPEVRRQKSRNGRPWTLNDAALLSVGFAYRDQLAEDVQASESQKYAAIIEAVESRGVRAFNAKRIADSDVSSYAHKLPTGLTAQPFQVMVAPGTLIEESTLLAVGQSRHLGGGLLCPVDVPEVVAAIWETDR